MSGNIPQSESENKENVYLDAHNKFSGNCKNKKGLIVNADCSILNCTTVLPKTCCEKTNFKIFCDDDKESSRSRSRERKNMCKIRKRNSDKTTEKTNTLTTKVEKKKSSDAILYRARSSSNYRSKVSIDNNNMNNKLFQRSCSETRKIPPQYAQCVAAASSHTPTRLKSKHLSAEVKKRTLTSIEMWKDKMRKSYGAVPKNLANKYPNVHKTHTKIKQRKSVEFVLEPQRLNLQSKIDQIKPKNKNENENVKTIHSWGTVIKHLPNEFVPILQDNNLLYPQFDMNSNIAGNVQPNNTLISSTTSATPLDGPSSLPLTPTKVRYVKREVTCKLSTDIEVFNDIHSFEHAYFDDVPYMERKREDNAPKLSFRFLKQDVNASQRNVIVGYLIRLGVHCEYSSNLIYQTVKLFDVTIDRILVDTNDIQLLALTCLWITLKREVTSHKMPSVTTVLQLAKDLYINREKDLLMYEKKILYAVEFNLRFGDPFSLLCYYLLDVVRSGKCNINLNDVPRIYFCGSYLLDISMLDEKLSDTSVCVLCVMAAELSLCFIYSNDIINLNYAWNYQEWRNKLLLTEWEQRNLSFIKQIIIQQALTLNKFGATQVYKKYLRSKYGKVSDFVLNKMKKALNSVNKI
ncbi:uncharacterized protein LOC114934455 [Nylanderia fulva]|uniref:uncharacterized protein LOC114934455 n=1 Tax=Nylanderia fulva TaxID=613905 RepID=UPI0010FB95C4|nr:uncharacterized protein LOC114934455 [Nylanderia fulva]